MAVDKVTCHLSSIPGLHVVERELAPAGCPLTSKYTVEHTSYIPTTN